MTTAQARLVEEHLHIPRRVIYRLCPDQAGNEDLMQECYLAMCQAAPFYKSRAGAKPSTFFWSVCSITVKRYLSGSSPQPRPMSDAKGIKGEEQSRKMEAAEFRCRVAALTPEEQMVVNALIKADYNKSAAARALNTSVYKLLKTARRAGNKLK